MSADEPINTEINQLNSDIIAESVNADKLSAPQTEPSTYDSANELTDPGEKHTENTDSTANSTNNTAHPDITVFSPKDRITAFILQLFFFGVGGGYWYLGKIKSALACLLPNVFSISILVFMNILTHQWLLFTNHDMISTLYSLGIIYGIYYNIFFFLSLNLTLFLANFMCILGNRNLTDGQGLLLRW